MKNSLFPALVLCSAFLAHGAVVLTGDTNRPDTSVFPIGEQVKLTFKLSGLKPVEKTSLILKIADERDRALKTITLPVCSDVQGAWSGTVEAPAGKLGFYRVRAQLPDGTTIKKTVSREAGFLTYAVVPGEKQYKLYPMDETFFGILGPCYGGWENQIGLRWTMGGKAWRDLEPKTPRSYIDNPDSGKIRVHPPELPWKKYWMNCAMHHRSPWMNDGKYFEVEQNRLKKFTHAGEKLTEDFFAVFARNDEKDLAQPFAFIQYTWEPMYPWGFKGTIEDLVNIHKAVYKGIHRNSKRVKLLGPTSAGLATLEWHEKLFQSGLLKYIDALSIHPYFAFPPEQNNLVETIRALREMIRKYAGREMEIYGNEAGFPTHEKIELELPQMYGILRSNLIFLGEGFQCNLLFYSHDYSGEPGYGIMYNLDPKRNWGPRKTAPKPIIPAIGAAALFLNGHTSAGAIETLGETAWGYAYQRKDGFTTLALWDYSGNPVSVEIPVGKEKITVGDMMGNTRSILTQGGNLKLTLTEDPVYVIGVDEALWGRNAIRELACTSSRLEGTVGETLTVTGSFDAKRKNRTGIVRLLPDSRMPIPTKDLAVKLRKGEKMEFLFDVLIPATLPSGRYPVSLRYLENGKTVTASGVLINVHSPVGVNHVLPAFQDGKYGVELSLTNRSTSGVSGRADVRIPGNPDGQTSSVFSLKKGETKLFFAPFSDLESNPLKNECVEVRFSTSTGYRFRHDGTMNFAKAVKLPNQVVDGSFSDWKGVPMHSFDPSMIIDPGKIYKGRADLDAKIGFAWNEKYLLFRVEVLDDRFVQNHTGWATWNGDSLQFAFSKAYAYKSTSNMYEDKMNVSLTELDFALTKKGPEVFRTISCDETLFPTTQIPVSKCPFSVKKKFLGSGNGVRIEYEIAVPWHFLNRKQPPVPGERIGWAMTVNDRDDETNTGRAHLGVFQLKKAAGFGALILVP